MSAELEAARRLALEHDVRNILEQPPARRIIGRILHEGYYGRSTLVLGDGGRDMTAYNEGRRSIALELAETVNAAGRLEAARCLAEYEDFERTYQEGGGGDADYD